MKAIINNTSYELKYADTFFKKLVGLCFKKNISYILRFRCNGIHTFFMRENIDIILTDKNNNVLYTYNNFKKNRILLPKKNVYWTYELPANTIKNKIIKKLVIIDD